MRQSNASHFACRWRHKSSVFVCVRSFNMQNTISTYNFQNFQLEITIFSIVSFHIRAFFFSLLFFYPVQALRPHHDYSMRHLLKLPWMLNKAEQLISVRANNETKTAMKLMFAGVKRCRCLLELNARVWITRSHNCIGNIFYRRIDAKRWWRSICSLFCSLRVSISPATEIVLRRIIFQHSEKLTFNRRFISVRQAHFLLTFLSFFLCKCEKLRAQRL